MFKLIFLVLFLHGIPASHASEEFLIEIKRHTLKNNLLEGELFVNKKKIGDTYERHDLRITSGIYPGFLRYISKRHAVGPFGQIGEKGDFLLEIGDVSWTDGKKRTNLLFHGGNKPEHSEGCIMLGAVSREGGVRYLKPNHTLSKLRRLFYGTELPNSTPNKTIQIIIEGFSPNILGKFESNINSGGVSRRNILHFELKNGKLLGTSTTFINGKKGNIFKIENISMVDKSSYSGKVMGAETSFKVHGDKLVRKNSFSTNEYNRISH